MERVYHAPVTDETVVEERGGHQGSFTVELAGPPPVLAGRYEITGLVGRGGMGTVYRARDRELDETVAIKILERQRASHDAVDRFRQEVRLARKVTHRNVVRIFDIGEDAGVRFLSMEYVDGESLADRLRRSARLPLEDVLAIARELCAGLAASHEAGVLHGDLKPSNVLCARAGRIVITDFGISRAFGAPIDALGEWAYAGTPGYMAPEHVLGATDLDARADVYALGCVLFYLLTGQPPWKGPTYASVVAARVVQQPRDPREIAPEVPAAIADVVRACMARERDARLASAAAVLAALPGPSASASARARVAPPVERTRRVAVLAFEDGGGEEERYLAMGLTNALVESLASIDGLRVIARGSTLGSRPSDARAHEARALGADAVVDGTFARDGDRIFATIRLAAAAGLTLWTRRYETSATRLFEVAAEAAAEVARALADRDVRPTPRRELDPTTLDLYVKGRYFYQRCAHDGRTIELLRRAHERAPEDGHVAAAYALAQRRQLNTAMAALDRDGPRLLAEAVAAKHPDIAGAHVALALVHFDDAEFRSAAISLKRAAAIDPDDLDVVELMGSILAEAGRFDEAAELLARANEASAYAAAGLARLHALRGDWASAEAVVNSRLTAASAGVQRWVTRARLAIWRGDRDHARAELAAMEADGALNELERFAVRVLFGVVLRGELDPVARERIHALFTREHAVPRRVAFHAQVDIECLVVVGRADQALGLVPALEQDTLVDVAWAEHCPVLAPIRDEPAFVALRRATAARAKRMLDVLGV
jgi:serine/threonine-protein kinase